MTGRLRRGTLDVHDVKNKHSYSQHRGDPDEPRVCGFIHKNILSHHTTSSQKKRSHFLPSPIRDKTSGCLWVPAKSALGQKRTLMTASLPGFCYFVATLTPLRPFASIALLSCFVDERRESSLRRG